MEDRRLVRGDNCAATAENIGFRLCHSPFMERAGRSPALIGLKTYVSGYERARGSLTIESDCVVRRLASAKGDGLRRLGTAQSDELRLLPSLRVRKVFLA